MWQFKKNSFDLGDLLVQESLFMNGNGYLGVRGAFEEGYYFGTPIQGTYINGLYDRFPMHHAEMAKGFPTVQDKQPRLADTQTCHIYLDSEQVTLNPASCTQYERVLDYKQGITLRSYNFMTKAGKEAQIKFLRMASLTELNAFIYRIEVIYNGEIHLESALIGEVENFSDPTDVRVAQGHAKLMNLKQLGALESLSFALLETRHSQIEQATAVKHIAYQTDRRLCKRQDLKVMHDIRSKGVWSHVQGHGQVNLDKLCIFTDGLRSHSSLDSALTMANTFKIEALLEDQSQFLERYWEKFYIDVRGTERAQKDLVALRYMQFQLLQSIGCDSFSNVAAKGLSGEGYEGHYFWDTEIYMLPIVQLFMPDRAQALLSYRHRILPQAQARAKELGHQKGASYPWRTISGIESSGYFPAGTAQYHLNADIAFSFIQFYLAFNDFGFMLDKGCSTVWETARIWLEIGHPYQDEFCIDAVTGPDEYTAIVNNNFFTNAMAQFHLRWAVKLHKMVENELVNPSAVSKKAQLLMDKHGLSSDEVEKMTWAADHMRLPFDHQLKICKQDDTFTQKAPWPFALKGEDGKPLLFHYHPLTIYRYQVLKQADTVLAFFLRDDLIDNNPFNLECFARTYDYYEAITTHDSSLSSCIYGIMASRLNQVNRAYDFFSESIDLDLENTHGNTRDGLHMANISGTLLSVTHGFAGLRIAENKIILRPRMPKAWTDYSFSFAVTPDGLNAQTIRVSIHKGIQSEVKIDNLSDGTYVFEVYDKPYELGPKQGLVVAFEED